MDGSIELYPMSGHHQDRTGNLLVSHCLLCTVHTQVDIHTYIRTYVHVSEYTPTHTLQYVHIMRSCRHIHAHGWLHTTHPHTHTYLYMCTRTHTHTLVHVHTHTHTHTYIPTYSLYTPAHAHTCTCTHTYTNTPLMRDNSTSIMYTWTVVNDTDLLSPTALNTHTSDPSPPTLET